MAKERSWDTFPCRLDFLLCCGGEAGFFEDSSAGCDDGPGWDIAGRFRVPRREAAGRLVARGEVTRRCRLDFRWGD